MCALTVLRKKQSLRRVKLSDLLRIAHTSWTHVIVFSRFFSFFIVFISTFFFFFFTSSLSRITKRRWFPSVYKVNFSPVIYKYEA